MHRDGYAGQQKLHIRTSLLTLLRACFSNLDFYMSSHKIDTESFESDGVSQLNISPASPQIVRLKMSIKFFLRYPCSHPHSIIGNSLLTYRYV